MIDFSKITGASSSSLVSSGSEHSVRTGDIVFVKVLDAIPPSSWKVSIGGKPYTAFSELQLKPGDAFSALVSRRNDKLHLQLPVGKNDLITAFLNRHGLPVNGITQALVNGFIRNGLPVDPEKIGAARKILERADGSVRKNARFLSILSGKGLSFFPPPGIDVVNGFFGSGDEKRDRRESRHGDNGNRDLPEAAPRSDHEETDDGGMPAALETAVCAKDDFPGDRLHLFNHVREGSKHWVIIPIRYKSGDTFWNGQIRMLLDDTSRSPECLSVSVSDGCSDWSFAVEERGGRKTVKLFAGSDADRKAAGKALPELARILEASGVRLDGNIADINDFDGFSGFDADITFKSVDVSL